VPIVKAEMNDEQKKSINIREMLINRNIKKDKDTVNVSLMECKLNPLELRDYSERQSLHDLISLDAQPLFNKPLNLLILIIVLLIGGGLIVSYLTGGFGL
jgi:hypothetical protein